MRPPHRKATALVADGHEVVRVGVRHILETASNVSVIAEACDAKTALKLCCLNDPDVAIIDVSMPDGSGLGILPQLRQSSPQTRVIAFGVQCDMACAEEILRAGAHGYLLKNTSARDLCSAVSAVLAGKNYCSAELVERGEIRRGPAVRLTVRERQILVRIASGQTNKQIAAELGISPRTVETHRESMTRKLGISTVAGLTRYAIENGYLTLSE
jgi:DNA-binding NarL/FixJ family response regulator